MELFLKLLKLELKFPGPVPKKKGTTQSIAVYDCMLLSVTSYPGTENFKWREKKPCSDQRTRVLGKVNLVPCHK